MTCVTDRLVQIFGRESTYVEIQKADFQIVYADTICIFTNQLREKTIKELGFADYFLIVSQPDTGDVHDLDAGNAFAHEALLCIQSGDTLENPGHWKFDTNEFFFKRPWPTRVVGQLN